MNEDLHNDQLEQFFKKELGDLSDNPSPEFWDKLSPQIPDKPKRKNRFAILPFWKIGAVAATLTIFTLGIYQWLNYNKELTNLSQTIENQQNDIDNLNTQIDSLKNKSNVNSQTELQNATESITTEKPFNSIDNQQKKLANNTNEENSTINTNVDNKNIVEQNSVYATKQKRAPNTIVENNIFDNKTTKIVTNEDLENQLLIANTTSIITAKQKTNKGEIKKLSNIGIQNSYDFELSNIELRGLKQAIPMPENIEANLLQNSEFQTAGVYASSQEILKKPSINKGFFTGLRFAPTLAHRFLKTDDKDHRRDYNEKEKLGLDYSFGAEIGYTLTNHWSIISGVGITVENQPLFVKPQVPINNGEKGHFTIESSYGNIYVDADFKHDKPGSNPPPPPPDSLNVKANVKGNIQVTLVNIPLLAEYRLGWKKFTLAFKSGIAVEKIAAVKTNIKRIDFNNDMDFYHDKSLSRVEKFDNKISVDWIVGSGIYYALTDRFNIYLEPYLKGGLTPIFNDDKVKTYPYSIALNTGFRLYL